MKNICLLFFIFIKIAFAVEFDEKVWRKKVESQKEEDLYAKNFKDGLYFNPWMPQEKTFWDVLRWKFFSKADREFTDLEENFLPKVLPNTITRMKKIDGDFILWIGHGTFLIRLNGVYILTDPIISKRVIIVSRDTPPAITFDELKNFNKKIFVLISHNHYDHFDIDTLRSLPANSTIITPKGFSEFQDDIKNAKIEEMNWWQKKIIDGAIKITALPAQHWSKRIWQGNNKSLWVSFMIQSPTTTIYFGGDGGYFIGYKVFSKVFGEIDYALVPVTAYHPRWFMHYAHMNAREAIDAFFDLKAKKFIPTQWGTFQLGDGPSGVPFLDLQMEIKKRNLNKNTFHFPSIGEFVKIN